MKSLLIAPFSGYRIKVPSAPSLIPHVILSATGNEIHQEEYWPASSLASFLSSLLSPLLTEWRKELIVAAPPVFIWAIFHM